MEISIVTGRQVKMAKRAMKESTINGKPLRVILSRIESFVSAARYRGRFPYLFLANGFAFPLAQLFKPQIFLRALRLSFKFGMPHLFFLPLCGAEILVKNNVRISFFENKQTPAGAAGKVSVKIALPSAYRSGSLAREIRARKFLLRSCTTNAIPKLVAYDCPKLTWLKEEYIGADPAVSSSVKLDRFLNQHAHAMYAHFARPRSVARSLRTAGVIFAEIAKILDSVESSVPAYIEQGTWPVSMTHGDLCAGNMIAGGENLIVVDWEQFGRRPVARDLLRLYQVFPERTLGLLSSINGPQDIAAEFQIRIAFAIELAFLRRDWQQTLDYLEKNLGLSSAAALERASGTETAYVRLIETTRTTMRT